MFTNSNSRMYLGSIEQSAFISSMAAKAEGTIVSELYTTCPFSTPAGTKPYLQKYRHVFTTYKGVHKGNYKCTCTLKM